MTPLLLALDSWVPALPLECPPCPCKDRLGSTRAGVLHLPTWECLLKISLPKDPRPTVLLPTILHSTNPFLPMVRQSVVTEAEEVPLVPFVYQTALLRTSVCRSLMVLQDISITIEVEVVVSIEDGAETSEAGEGGMEIAVV